MMPTKALKRSFLMVSGFFFLGLGLFGIVMPGFPGTVFLILALACFARSNPNLEGWMLQHPKFGQTLRDWRETGAIRPGTKFIAVSCIVAGVTLTELTSPSMQLKLVMLVLGIVGVWYVLSRPTRTND